MGLASIVARRSLGGHPGRTLFSILGVALGIATVVAVFTVDHVTVLSRTRVLGKQDFGADMEVRSSGKLDDPEGELLKMEGIAGVAAFFQNDVRLRPARSVAGEDHRPITVRLIALESDAAPTLGVYHVEEGDDLTASSSGPAPNGVLIGRALAQSLELAVGDRLLLSPPVKAARKKCIDGEMQEGKRKAVTTPEEPFLVRGILAREGIGRTSRGRLVVMDFDTGRRLLSDVHLEPRYWVKRDQTTDVEQLESNLGGGFTFDRNEKNVVGQMADERAFRNGVRMAGLFALVLGLFVIFHTLSMSLLERVREVGTLHSLGCTRFQIGRVFFSEAMFVAIVAGVLGFSGGLGLAWTLLRNGITTLGVTGPTGPFEVPWRSTVPLALLGVGIALIGSIFPILTARGTDVVAFLRGEDVRQRRTTGKGFHVAIVVLLIAVLPTTFFLVVPLIGAAGEALVRTVVIGLAVLGLLFAVALFLPNVLGRIASMLTRPFAGRWPLASLLAGRTLERNPARIGASVVAIALVTSAFVGLKGMTNSLRAEIEVWGEEAVADKVFIEGMAGTDVVRLEAHLAELPEVLGVEPGDVRAHINFLMLGLRAEQLGGYGPAADPEVLRALRERQSMIISERLARQRVLSVGDTLLVNTSGHGVQEFEVVAISDAYGYFPHPDERAYGVTSERWLQRYFCLGVEQTTTAAVRLQHGADLGVVEAHLRARMGAGDGLRFRTGADILEWHQADLEQDFVLFDIILLLTAALAGLGVLNGQLLSALERRKELGVLRALGMTRGQVAGAVLLEAGILGLGGGLLGLAVGSGLTPVMVSALRILSGLDLPLRWAGPHLALFLGGALVLAVLAGLYPIWRMNRMDAVRAVRTG